MSARLTLRDGAEAAGIPWETLRTWIKRGWVTLPAVSTTGKPLVAGATRRLTIMETTRLRITRKLITIGIHPREAWTCSGSMDLGTLADLDQAIALAGRVRASVYLKGTTAMPGLNFKPEFASKVLEGSKPFTLRKRRADGREAAIGAALMLFTGMRTKACRKFATTTVVGRATVAFNEHGMVSVLHEVVMSQNEARGKGPALAVRADEVAEALVVMQQAARFPNGPDTPARLERIAQWDGFPTWAAMWEFHKGQALNMDGVAVREFFGFGVIKGVCSSGGEGVV